VRALVAGALGQLGRELASRLGGELAWAGGRDGLDVTDEPAVFSFLAQVKPDVVFNATAWNRVDAAEAEPERAFAVNAHAPRTLARAAADIGARLVHVSTDYVFDGLSPRPYGEEDEPRPLSVYGASKLEGERNVLAAGPQHLVVRTSGVLGRAGSGQKGGSFVSRILEQARAGKPLRVVADQTFAPTFADELADALVALARSPARGLLHVTNAGSCSWHELALAALREAGSAAPVAAIKAAELKLPARRPAYSVLDNSRYLSLGLTRPRPWQDALRDLVASARG
jgi:dTDP-4-dehydrorhamnose reductase